MIPTAPGIVNATCFKLNGNVKEEKNKKKRKQKQKKHVQENSSSGVNWHLWTQNENAEWTDGCVPEWMTPAAESRAQICVSKVCICFKSWSFLLPCRRRQLPLQRVCWPKSQIKLWTITTEKGLNQSVHRKCMSLPGHWHHELHTFTEFGSTVR